MSRLTSRIFVLTVIILAFGQNAWASEVVFRFATATEGRAILTTRDDYVQRLSPFDRASKTKRGGSVSEADFLSYAGSHVLDWSDSEKAELQPVLDDVATRANQLGLDWPQQIFIVKTSGKEEGNAAYTRANAIFLPLARLKPAPSETLNGLIAHELFHVLSRQNAALREKLYATIGFQNCGELVLPPKLINIKLTNPDAPVNEHCIKVTVDGQPAWVMPILYAKTEAYDAARGEDFFSYLEFNFLRVRTAQGPSGQTSFSLGQDIEIVPLDRMAGFFEQIGMNTNYIIHPEETLADNFSFFLLRKKDLKSPQVIQSMQKILGEARKQN